ncbi:substrate-binding domain-containing protein [Nocardiopsis dassonvillei]|uniref:substrate-binding domain-containing protein n=1 Tax=Nocardiopsis dassonvillei TaxID=2014 RepID=UPI0035563847
MRQCQRLGRGRLRFVRQGDGPGTASFGSRHRLPHGGGRLSGHEDGRSDAGRTPGRAGSSASRIRPPRPPPPAPDGDRTPARGRRGLRRGRHRTTGVSRNDPGQRPGRRGRRTLSEESVTGVCTFNDETAIAVLAGMREHALSAPADMAVIGVDDTSPLPV